MAARARATTGTAGPASPAPGTITPQSHDCTRRATSVPSSATGTAPFRHPSYNRLGSSQSEFWPA